LKNKRKGVAFIDTLKTKVFLQRYGARSDELGPEVLKRATVCTLNKLVIRSQEREVNLKPRISNGPFSGLDMCECPEYATIEVPDEPDFLNRQVAGGKTVGEIFQFEFNGVISTTLFGCELKNMKQACAFCRSAGYSGMKFSLEQFREALEIITQNMEPSLVLNAGTIPDEYSGYSLISPYVKAARDLNLGSISIELCPPKQPGTERQLVSWMKDDGVTSAQFNMELYDRNLRRILMPFKGTIPVSSYLRILGYSAETFGFGKASTVLLLGIEKAESVMRAAELVLGAGAIPSVEAFRPVPGSELENLEPAFSVDEIVAIATEVAGKVLGALGKDALESREGCMKCGGCPLIFDVI